VNGEIYNHKDLRAHLRRPHEFQTLSDCEVLLYLYDELAPRDFLNRINGIFAFVLYDPARDRYLIARDIGVPHVGGTGKSGYVRRNEGTGGLRAHEGFPPGTSRATKP
jgi:asparagine synthase (glutamine-hydrolysing)